MQRRVRINKTAQMLVLNQKTLYASVQECNVRLIIDTNGKSSTIYGAYTNIDGLSYDIEPPSAVLSLWRGSDILEDIGYAPVPTPAYGPF